MFVAELGPTSALVFSTYLGGPRLDQGNAVAVDVSGTIHLVGESTGEFPLLNAVSADRSGSPAALLRSPNSNGLFSPTAPGFGSKTSLGVLAFQSSQVVYAASASGRLYRSLDTANSWLPVPTTLPAPIHFLAFSGPNLLAGTSQGLYFSTDQRVSWALRHAGPNLVGLAVNSTSSAFYLALSAGFYRSNDLGRTWALASSATAQTLAIDPVDPFRLYLATPTALLRSNDGGTTWAAVSSQSFSQIVPTATAQLYGVSNGRLFASTNAGQSWSPVLFPIADPLVRVAVDPSDSRLLPAATTATGLWRSLDRGLTWAAASTADSSPLDVVFAPNGSALASFNLTSDAVLARWGRLRTAGSSRYTYYQASVTYLGNHLADVGRAVAADANTVGSYIAGQSPTGAFVARFAPSPAACTFQVTPRERTVFPSPEGALAFCASSLPRAARGPYPHPTHGL